MKILLVGNYPPDRQESMLRFAALMERELTARGHTVTLLQPQARLHGAHKPGGRRRYLAYADKLLVFPRTLRRAAREHDVTHICDHSNAIYTRYLRGLPHVVTCHDVLAIRSAMGEIAENPVSATGRPLQRWILAGLKVARYIVCPSQSTLDEMLRVTGRGAEGSELVPMSLSYPYSPMPRAEALERLAAIGFDAAQPYFLHVGGGLDFWYKNRRGLLRIYARLCALLPAMAPRLLLVGGEIEPEVLAFLEDAGLSGRVSHLGGIASEDLRAAYSAAEGLLFPSWQEGFGWPVLEAQACGCPVFASRRAPMTEVGADAAVYFDPEQPEAAAALVADALAQRPAMRAAGLRNVQRYTVDRMLDAYVAAYAKVAGGV